VLDWNSEAKIFVIIDLEGCPACSAEATTAPFSLFSSSFLTIIWSSTLFSLAPSKVTVSCAKQTGQPMAEKEKRVYVWEM
jgi:hypothetical protein